MRLGFWQEIVHMVETYWPWLLKGAGTTMLIALTGTIVGLVIGLGIGTIRTIPLGHHDAGPVRRVALRVLDWILGVYIEVFRGTPMMVQAMVIYYGLREGAGIDLRPIEAGILIVSINTGAYMAEIVRGGIQAVDPGQMEAGKALGMTHWQIMRGTILPQAFRNILPATGNEFVINIKDTSVLNIITVTELFFSAKDIAAATYRTYEAYILIAAIYLILTYTTTRILRLVERRLAGPEHFTLATSSTMPESILTLEPPAGSSAAAPAKLPTRHENVFTRRSDRDR
jgi:putative lysine transport system permease protein